jgi:nucleoside-diphosphate-sugar epimerase
LARQKVIITGAGGLIGGILRERLSDEYDISCVDVRRVRSSSTRRVDSRKLRSVIRAFEGHDVVVDLAALPAVRTPWEHVYSDNVPATINAFEAARSAGCRRVVYASSNHVVGLYERDEPYASIVAGEYDGLDPGSVPLITSSSPIRPDSYYGIGKAFGEAAGRYYAEERGLSVHCLRIGSVTRTGGPTDVRCFATLITHDDLVRLVRASIEAPADIGYGIFYGVSANKWNFWDIAEARAMIGYDPRGNAESWR